MLREATQSSAASVTANSNPESNQGALDASWTPHAQTRLREQRQQSGQRELIFVKWATPTEEALSTVRLADALVKRHIATPSEVAIAVPNRIWAANIARAASNQNINVSLCIAMPETPAVQEAFASLRSCADHNLRGRSLARCAGLDTVAELAHGLLGMQGNENAEQLEQLLREQIAAPSVPAHTTHIPIMLASDMRHTPRYLFLTGCVDGLFPHAHAYNTDNAQDWQDQQAALDTMREQFWRAATTSTVRTTLSCFVKAPETLASQAHLKVARYKTEDGVRLAMCRPTPFIADARQQRPSTTGGQALLRTYGLN